MALAAFSVIINFDIALFRFRTNIFKFKSQLTILRPWNLLLKQL